MTTTITLEPITRIEGHAKITLDLNDAGAIEKGHLHVLEIRGFEKLVEGMELGKMPLITGRICGICPAAHHLAAVIAIESGCNVTIPPEAKLLRELLYMGHILHSHALSCFVLVGPDLFRTTDNKSSESIFNLLSSSPELAKKALRIRSIGQKTVEKVGGRGIHPITAIPGGMASRPSAEDMSSINQWGSEALALLSELYPVLTEKIAALETLRESTNLSMKAAALSSEETLDFLSGNAHIVGLDGSPPVTFTAANYSDHLREHVMP